MGCPPCPPARKAGMPRQPCRLDSWQPLRASGPGQHMHILAHACTPSLLLVLAPLHCCPRRLSGRRVTFEYTLLSGVNDQLRHAGGASFQTASQAASCMPSALRCRWSSPLLLQRITPLWGSHHASTPHRTACASPAHPAHPPPPLVCRGAGGAAAAARPAQPRQPHPLEPG